MLCEIVLHNLPRLTEFARERAEEFYAMETVNGLFINDQLTLNERSSDRLWRRNVYFLRSCFNFAHAGAEAS